MRWLNHYGAVNVAAALAQKAVVNPQAAFGYLARHGDDSDLVAMTAMFKLASDPAAAVGKVLAPAEPSEDGKGQQDGLRVVQEDGGSVGLYVSGIIGLDVDGLGILDAMEREDVKGKELNLYLNSPGGNAFDGIDIANKLARFAPGYTAYVEGLVGSAATVAAVSGGRLLFGEATEWLVHEAAYETMCFHATATEMEEKLVPSLRATNISIADLYAKRTGSDRKTMLELMRKDSIMNAEDAVKWGFGEMASADSDAVDKPAQEAKMEVSDGPKPADFGFDEGRMKAMARFFVDRADRMRQDAAQV